MTETRTAVMLMGYGTPRTPADILPYYTDIRRGNPPTTEQLDNLTARYEAIGGISPLAQRSEAQRSAVQAALDRVAGGRYHVVLGMKHATPFIEESVGELAIQGFRRIVGVVLAPHYSAFSVGQYLDRLTAAAASHDIAVNGIRSWATEPAFIDFIAAAVRDKLATLPDETRVLFTSHSLPERILASGDPYPSELQATAQAVASTLGLDNWGVAWQSAGRTPEPWLGPDILHVVDELAADGRTKAVLVSAVGFVADHLEVLYDLDIEASQRATSRGLAFERTACVNDDPTVMLALADLIIGAT
ncbi:MAG: protoporphyrin/coproporphyrin ferrochelatase [Ilumatobacteraceae bacterium]|jgi:ferrochelatase